MTTTPAYQVLLLGEPGQNGRDLVRKMSDAVTELGLPLDTLTTLSASEAITRNRKLPTAAIYFGTAGTITDVPTIRDLLQDSAVIIPVVTDLSKVSKELPNELSGINALALSEIGSLDRLASLILETFKLLRRERRIFISYKRDDSQPLANRLYDEFDRRGFDPFIDVRSVPPGADFQSILWHRLADCDVMVLIDTENFRQSRWTKEELAKANATNLQILHLLWPGQTEDLESSFSHFFELRSEDFGHASPGHGETITTEAIERISIAVENLRARAIALRYRYLIDSFCDAARDLKLKPRVQPERWITLGPGKKGELFAIPAVGIPTSDRVNEIFHAVTDGKASLDGLWVLYDDRGLLKTWLDHLGWLNNYLPVRCVRMAEVPDALAAYAKSMHS